MKELLEYLNEFNGVSIFLRLILAAFYGGIIGLERRIKRRAAGVRTFALVCVGAALAMLTNEYLILNYEVGDPGRMAAQVISGIGFLGAGTIILTGKQHVKGLTTAASLWATASVGIAIGCGFYVGAFIGFFVIFASIVLLHRLEEKVSLNSIYIELYIELEDSKSVENFIKYIKNNDFLINSFEKRHYMGGNRISVSTEINLRKKMRHGEIVAEINMIEGVVYAEEIR